MLVDLDPVSSRVQDQVVTADQGLVVQGGPGLEEFDVADLETDRAFTEDLVHTDVRDLVVALRFVLVEGLGIIEEIQGLDRCQEGEDLGDLILVDQIDIEGDLVIGIVRETEEEDCIDQEVLDTIVGLCRLIKTIMIHRKRSMTFRNKKRRSIVRSALYMQKD